MNQYFKRLKTHAGIPTATFMTIMGTFAGATNQHMSALHGAIFGCLIVGGISWIAVLLSNFKKR